MFLLQKYVLRIHSYYIKEKTSIELFSSMVVLYTCVCGEEFFSRTSIQTMQLKQGFCVSVLALWGRGENLNGKKVCFFTVVKNRHNAYLTYGTHCH